MHRNIRTFALLCLPIAAASCSAQLEHGDAGAPLSSLEARPHNPTCIAPPSEQVPERLSQLGCFDPERPWLPGPGLIPYEVNAPLWSDRADKQRWLALPDGTHITLDPSGRMLLPTGAVLLKSFARAGRRLETRVWLNHAEVGWRGYTYAWQPDGSDAVLAPEAGMELPSTQQDGAWSVPGRSQCTQCHQPGADLNLGLNLAQLDVHDQLASWQGLELFAETVDPRALTAHPQLVDYRDTTEPLDLRARSYLHANCSSCHHTAVSYCSGDLRAGTPLADAGICEQPPLEYQSSWNLPESIKLLTPGDAERSMILQRLRAPAGTRLAMPPLGRREVDSAGVALIEAWITELMRCAP